MANAKLQFEAEVIEGHKGVRAALVPFDPAAVWKRPPTRLAGRRHGWLVRGTLNGVRFDGYVGERWGRFFIALDEATLAAANASPGGLATLVVAHSHAEATYRRAVEQSKRTTQPGRVRDDVVDFASAPVRAPRPGRARGPK